MSSEEQKVWSEALKLYVEISEIKNNLSYKEQLLKEAIQAAKLLALKEKDDALKKGQ